MFVKLVVLMDLFDLLRMDDNVICSNCGLSYLVSENELCNHCGFSIKEK